MLPDEPLSPEDVLLMCTPRIIGDGGWAPAYSFFFNRLDEFPSASPAIGYGSLSAADFSRAFTSANNGDATGYLDWSPEIDLSWPAMLIQADGACSGQWGLWYEWSAANSMYAGWPRNVLQRLSTINLGDNPQYPEDYLELYGVMKDERIRRQARRGLESLLRYRIPKSPGTWPFGILPWKDKVWNAHEPIEGAPLDQARGGPSPFAWRTLAKAQRYFQDDPSFCNLLEKAYQDCRAAYFTNLVENLRFPNDAGTALEAIAAHYQFTHSEKDREDLRSLGSAVLARHRQGIAGYGSEMPKYTMGLAAAYGALHDAAYLEEAQRFTARVIAPNLWRDRQFFDQDPKNDDRNPDPVSGHWEGMQFVRLYQVTGDEWYLNMAGFVWGSYQENEWDGQPLYHRWTKGPSAEGNFFTLHRYVACQMYPTLYKKVIGFRGTTPEMSPWRNWPLRAASGNCWIEIDEDGGHRASHNLDDPDSKLLVVQDGSGGGLYRPGTGLTIFAGQAAVGMKFDRWIVNFGDSNLVADPFSPELRVTMPAEPTGLTAHYKTDAAALHVIGTPGSGDAGCTREHAFDNDIGTYFDAAPVSGAWVGLDLGKSQRISRIRYWPRRGLEGRMPRGKFQGSNVSDFSAGVVDLFTIVKEPPTGGRMNEQKVTVQQAFRYVRYFGPPDAHCDVAELQIFVGPAGH